MYRNKLEEGQDGPRTILKILKQFGACKKNGIYRKCFRH